MLEPELKHSVAPDKLAKIQAFFHKLILRKALSPAQEMRLPSLEVLLEQEDPTMTFQVPFGVFVYRFQRLSFPIAIDVEREEPVLLTRSYQSMGEGFERHWVVTPFGGP